LKFRSDYIFYSLIYLFSFLGIKFQILLFILGFFNVYIPLFLLSRVVDLSEIKEKKYFLIIIFFISSISLVYIFSGIRQLLAFNFILLFLYQIIIKKKIYLAIFFYVLAALTHFSCVIFLPVFLISSFFNNKLILFFSFSFSIFILIFGIDYMSSDFIINLFSESEIYNKKLDSYIGLSSSTEQTTTLTYIALILKSLWFYFAIIYSFIYWPKNKLFSNLLITSIFICFLFIFYPAINIRFQSFFKIIFALYLIHNFVKLNHYRSFIFFFIMYSFEPLYNIFRLQTISFIEGYFRFENITSIGIFLSEYTYVDMISSTL